MQALIRGVRVSGPDKHGRVKNRIPNPSSYENSIFRVFNKFVKFEKLLSRLRMFR
jgi:hypothetical protein